MNSLSSIQPTLFRCDFQLWAAAALDLTNNSKGSHVTFLPIYFRVSKNSTPISDILDDFWYFVVTHKNNAIINVPFAEQSQYLEENCYYNWLQ